jgi:hypothetical protein
MGPAGPTGEVIGFGRVPARGGSWSCSRCGREHETATSVAVWKRGPAGPRWDAVCPACADDLGRARGPGLVPRPAWLPEPSAGVWDRERDLIILTARLAELEETLRVAVAIAAEGIATGRLDAHDVWAWLEDGRDAFVERTFAVNPEGRG